MATTINKKGSLTGNFDKVGAASATLRTTGEYTNTVNQWLSGETFNFGHGGNANAMTAMLYGTDFRPLQNLQNLKITGFTLSLHCGGWNTVNFFYKGSTTLSFRVVTDFVTSETTDTSSYTDLGDGSISLASGSTAPQTFTKTHVDLPKTLAWINSNLTKFINGYAGNGFGIRFYMKFGQFQRGTLAVDYTYDVNVYSVTVTAGTGGTATGGGSYEEGTKVTLSATPNDGYRFVKWSDGNTDATRTVTVSADTTYTAEFAEDGVNDMHCDAVQPVQLWADGKQCLQLWADGVKIFG